MASRKYLLTLLILGLTTGVIWAQDDGGRQSVSVGGSITAVETEFNSDTGETYDSETNYQLSLDFSYGYFVTDQVEVGFDVMGNRTWDDDETFAYGTFSLLGILKYHFVGEELPKGGDVVPYVGLQGGATMTSYSTSDGYGGTTTENQWSGSLGFMGGIEVFTSESSSFYCEYNFLWTETDYDWGTEDVYQHSGRFGAAWYF